MGVADEGWAISAAHPRIWLHLSCTLWLHHAAPRCNRRSFGCSALGPPAKNAAVATNTFLAPLFPARRAMHTVGLAVPGQHALVFALKLGSAKLLSSCSQPPVTSTT